MSGISLEQPPSGDNRDEMVEWLARMMRMISAEFEKGQDMDVYGFLPEAIQDGTVRYFSGAILPEITHKGPWIVIDGVWVSMV